MVQPLNTTHDNAAGKVSVSYNDNHQADPETVLKQDPEGWVDPALVDDIFKNQHPEALEDPAAEDPAMMQHLLNRNEDHSIDDKSVVNLTEADTAESQQAASNGKKEAEPVDEKLLTQARKLNPKRADQILRKPGKFPPYYVQMAKLCKQIQKQ